MASERHKACIPLHGSKRQGQVVAYPCRLQVDFAPQCMREGEATKQSSPHDLHRKIEEWRNDSRGRAPKGQSMVTFVVALGAAVWKDGQPSTTLERRTRHAVHVASQNDAQLILTGGVGLHPPSEASVAATLAQKLGFPSDRLLKEELSTSTQENLRFALALAKVNQDDRIIVVTDRFHGARTRIIARRLGFSIELSYPDPDLMPSRASVYAKGWAREFVAICALFLGAGSSQARTKSKD